MCAGWMQRTDRIETARTGGNRLYAHLYSNILTGRLRSGEALTATKIAEQHGIDCTPMRPGGFRSVHTTVMRCQTMRVIRRVPAIR